MIEQFRCANIEKPEDGTIRFADLLGKLENHSFYAFYLHDSMILEVQNSLSPLAIAIKTELERNGFKLEQILSSSLNGWEPVGYACYLLGGECKDFPERMLIRAGKFRASYQQNLDPVLSLNQCTAHELFNERYLFSALDFALEYLLWDDGGLWRKESWNSQIEQLEVNLNFNENQGRQRLAWFGSGWMSRSLKQEIYMRNGPWAFPPEIELWINSALENLEEYDKALGKLRNNSDILRRQSRSAYIRTLCDFLPYYFSRDKTKTFPSSSSADQGGPKRWRGILDTPMNLYLRHLILDGWVTLWPVLEQDGNTRLYYQPGSLALLYWAARQADKPWTKTPKEFLEGYDWSDKRWFGGNWHYPWKESPPQGTVCHQIPQQPTIPSKSPQEVHASELPFEFDVFLSHNSQDKPIVRKLAKALKLRNLRVWLDEEQTVPGKFWLDALEDIIRTTRTAAVLIGQSGLGPWETHEMRVCLVESVKRDLPVIPVLLPDAPANLELPLFLSVGTLVDLRGGLTTQGLNNLIWGITGNKPKV